MLSEILMSIDTENNGILSKDKILMVLEEYGEDGTFFSSRQLKNLGFNKSEVENLEEILKEYNGINISYYYECESTSEGEYVTELKECSFCEDKISNTGHIIKEKYQFQKKILEEFEDYKELEIKKYIQEKYLTNYKKLKNNITDIIPFIGSGVSIPLGIPDWKGLLILLNDGLVGKDKEEFENLVDDGDLFEAIEHLMNKSMTYTKEKVIKDFLSEYIEKNLVRNLSEEHHNIRDILNLDSDFFITTNYDEALSIYKNYYQTPLTLNDIEDMHIQLKNRTQSVIHLHGNVTKSSTMIVTKKDYKKMYRKEEILAKLSAIMGNKSLLFIGFSFKDAYFVDLYKKIFKLVGGTHYILTNDLTEREARNLLEKNLYPIVYNVENLDNENPLNHTQVLKYILQDLKR